MRKKSKVSMLIIAILLVAVAGFFYFYKGGWWACERGMWVKKGSPREKMPNTVCTSRTNTDNASGLKILPSLEEQKCLDAGGKLLYETENNKTQAFCKSGWSKCRLDEFVAGTCN